MQFYLVAKEVTVYESPNKTLQISKWKCWSKLMNT